MGLLDELRETDKRLRSYVRSDPVLPPSVYGDIDRAPAAGLSSSQAYSTIRRPRFEDASLDEMAFFIANNVKRQDPKAKKKRGFWTRVNDFVGGVVGEAKFTDQLWGVFDLVPHVYRAGREIEFQATGDREKPGFTKDFFNPHAWTAAWRTTQRGDDYFLDPPESKLPKVAEDLARKMAGGRSVQDAAVEIGIAQEAAQAIAAAPEVRKRIDELGRSKVTIGRGLIERFTGADPLVENKAFDVASGVIDFAQAFVGVDAVAGDVIKAVRAANRSVSGAAKMAGGLDALVGSPKMRDFFEFAAATDSPSAIKAKFKQVPVALADALSLARTPDEAQELFKRSALGVGDFAGQGRVADIPKQSVLAKVGEKAILLEDENRVARLYGKAIRGFRDLPKRELDPRDKEDLFSQVSALTDVFPGAFPEKKKREMLDRAIRATTPNEALSVVDDILKAGADVMKVKPHLRTPITRLYNQYWELRKFNIDPESGQEVLTVANQAIEKALPHLWSETVQKIPLFNPRELRDLRWSQGDLTKYFVEHPMVGDALLLPARFIGGIWKPIALASRLAWPIRVVGEERLRMLAKGRQFDPSRSMRARKLVGEFSVYGEMPARPKFWSHPFQYVSTMPTLPDDVADKVLTGKSRLVREESLGRGKTSPGVSLGKTAVPFDRHRQAVDGWQYMLGQLVDDPVSRALLQGRSISEVGDMLTGEWSHIRDDLIRVGQIEHPGDIDRYLATVIDRQAAVVHGNPELEDLVRSVARGEEPAAALKGKDTKKFLLSLENPPPYVKMDISATTGAVGLWAQMTEVAFKYLMDIPTNRLSRIREYALASDEAKKSLSEFAQREGVHIADDVLRSRMAPIWREENEELLRMLDDAFGSVGDTGLHGVSTEFLASERARLRRKLEAGPSLDDLDGVAAQQGLVTDRMILESARAFGANEVLATLYDPLKRTKVQQQLGTQFPFLAAWQEFMETWARIMGSNPQNIGRAARFTHFMSGRGEDSGLMTQGIAGPALDLAPVSWMVKGLTGSGTEFQSDLDSFNLFTSSPYPGTGPLTQLMVTVLAERKPDWEDALSFVAGPYGLRRTRDDGLLGYTGVFIDNLLPSWGREVWRAFDSVESSPEFSNRVAQEFRQIAVEKWGDEVPWHNPGLIEEVRKQAEDRARKVGFIVGLAKAVSPGSIQRKYPYREVVETFRGILDSAGEEEAHKWLTRELGEGAVFLVEPLSRASMPTTKQALKIWKDPESQRLAKRYGSLFWAMVETESAGEFDYSVYRWQHDVGLRKAQAPKFQMNPRAGQYTPGWIESAEIESAWRAYSGAREAGEAALEAGEVSRQEFLERMRSVRAQVALEFPHWAWAQEHIRNQSFSWQNFHNDMKGLRQSTKGRKASEGLGEFLEVFDIAQSELRALGLQPYSFDAVNGQPIRGRLNAAARAIAEDFPEFAPFYWRHLVWRLDPDIRETRLISSLDAQEPAA